MKIKTAFDLNQEVRLGLHRGKIKGLVTAITIQSTHSSYEVSWFHEGSRHSSWFTESELANYNGKEDTA